MAIDYTRSDRPRRNQSRVDSATQASNVEVAVSQPSAKINYTRTGRHPSRDSAISDQGTISTTKIPLVAHDTVDVKQRSRLAPQPRVGRTQSEAIEPALVTSANVAESLRASWSNAARSTITAVENAVSDFLATHPDTTALQNEMRSAHSSVTDAYKSRFGVDVPYGQGHVTSPREWITTASQWAQQLQTQRIPITQKGRQQDKASFNSGVPEIVAAYSPSLDSFEQDAWRSMVSGGSQAAAKRWSDEIRTVGSLKDPPAPVGPRLKPVSAAEGVAAGPGPLLIQVGYIAPVAVTFGSSAARNLSNDNHRIALGSIEIPLVLDLDAVGALFTSHADCLQQPILNLLAALPANQLLIKLFDPEQGGNSAKFLFDLGDAAEKIIGDRVKTSDRDLTALLQETEEHITLVTQKFLQGEHKSLTAYNKAAGEVAEPYRMLVFYDFPAGFFRAGRLDSDQLERVSRIIRNGPRCGVFVTMVGNSNFGAKILASGGHQASEDLRAIETAISGVPRLTHDSELDQTTLEHVQRAWGCTYSLSRAKAPTVQRFGARISSQPVVRWGFRGQSAPPRAIATSLIEQVQRNLHSAADVRVTPARVAQLAAAAQASSSATLGISTDSVAHPESTPTWWRASSKDRVAGHFGRIGAQRVANLTLDSEENFGALVGGRPGSGKSVLLHAVIMSIALEYSPREVELFLIDFKEGVEFKQYASLGLPHARVIAIESERDFGLSVLREANNEIARRGALFRDAGDGHITKLGQYRERVAGELPRMILIIDEFQQLFYRDDKIAGEAAEILEQILRKGRAFGVHVILASQSLAGMAAIGKHVLGFIPTRVAMQSSDADSRLILGDENPDAQTLSRAGEGILNLKGGLKDANERFQAAFWDVDERAEVLQELTRRARSEGIPNITTVFSGHEPVDVTTLDMGSLVANSSAGLSIPVGLPLTLGGSTAFADLRRDAGANVLIVDESLAAVATTCASLALQSVRTELLDFVAGDDEWEKIAEGLENLPTVTLTRRRGLTSLLNSLVQTVDARHNLSDFKSTAIVLVVAAMNRGRDFDPNSYDDDSPSNLLGRIVRDGPEVGVHVIASFDKAAAVDRRLGSNALNEFGLRLVGHLSRDDSLRIIDNENAADLKAGQAILEDVDRSSSTRVRKFSPPPPEWIGNCIAVG